MNVSAISFLNTLTATRGTTYRAPQVRTAYSGITNTFSGQTNLNAPSHADVCNVRGLLGDAVPGSTLCYCA